MIIEASNFYHYQRTFRVKEGAELEDVVKAAIKMGYRSIDKAAVYGNEASVGHDSKIDE